MFLSSWLKWFSWRNCLDLMMFGGERSWSWLKMESRINDFKRKRVVVVGGSIVGLCCVYLLFWLEWLEVFVFERVCFVMVVGVGFGVGFCVCDVFWSWGLGDVFELLFLLFLMEEVCFWIFYCFLIIIFNFFFCCNFGWWWVVGKCKVI